MWLQIASLIGAACALVAYIGYQRGLISRETTAYNALNLAAGVILATVATIDGRLGFILLNVVWGTAAIRPLLNSLRKPV
jgi:hypothetical protein